MKPISWLTLILWGAAFAVSAAEPPKINLNQATAASIAHRVKGIGDKRAQAIITYREQHHGFSALNELANVRGIGKNFVKNTGLSCRLFSCVGARQGAEKLDRRRNIKSVFTFAPKRRLPADKPREVRLCRELNLE